MKIFHCDHCDHLVFFENTRCVSCGHLLAFLPDLMDVGSLEPLEAERWSSPRAPGRAYRLCTNYRDEDVCNWAVPADDPNQLCESCRLTRVIPDLQIEGRRIAWYRLEVAKRRLVYTLLELGLPRQGSGNDSGALVFEFRADPTEGEPPVLTGHSNGIITVNIAEADDAERERRRQELGEPYRTLLGHFRHESGHYYWSRLIEHDAKRLEHFRRLFGDEREDYADRLERHYTSGPPTDWQNQFVSAYASAHAWEDWAETWAHYLHLIDTLETAASCGVSLRPRHAGEPSLPRVPEPAAKPSSPFERLIDDWIAVTYVLNNLNRGLGLPDPYPFVLSGPAIDKLRFVHEVAQAQVRATSDRRSAALP